MTRLEELKLIFQNVEEDQRRLVDRLLEEVVFLENQMTELKKLPFVRVHPQNPEIQKKDRESLKFGKKTSITEHSKS